MNVPNKAMVSKKYACVKLLIEAGVDANRLYRDIHSLLTVNAAANGDYKVSGYHADTPITIKAEPSIWPTAAFINIHEHLI